MYIHPLISGQPDKNWLEYIAAQFFKTPVNLALSLGCGGGGLERHAVALNIVDSFHAYDVSTGAIEIARNSAVGHAIGHRIDYRVADLNTLVLPEGLYDCVFASQSVHHIGNLEHYFEQVAKCLKPGGLFIINEFVGSNQFQWSDLQVQHAQSMLESIPEGLRQSIRGHGQKNVILRPTLEEMNNSDPTEAIRSADIIPGLQKHFEIVDQKDFGGTLLQLVLEDIVGNFSDQKQDREILQSLFDAEQVLLKSGILSSDFTLIVARHRKQPITD
ncbi:MAG: class I SAM-dependent methyltransferase [Gammaproteobacteria bacterium]|nr:class I SAM-dependent methyltransferase [Gammaproteobacteria bacterium]